LGTVDPVPLLVLLFLVVPVIEIYVLIQVGQEIGALSTIALLVLVSLVGAWLAKREGLGVWLRMQQQMGAGRLPATELLDAFLILLAAALLLTPGFLTDVLAVALLLPPSRALVRGVVQRSLRGRLITR
jgi:UPF0716 protein FxsA